ncbi:MAG: ParA family protein [Mesorhizobium sp.]|nr:ParA family protein [Mesorhizobium sp.]MCO5164542.1 ParA family protein [Mesorhizobium sp.]
MTLTLGVVSGKGGAGKTTIVMLIAGEYALQGKRVLLVDADARQNLYEWWKRCEAKDNTPEGIAIVTVARADNLAQQMKSAKRYDVVLIDAPGVDGVLTREIIKHCDLVLTPIQPAQDEIKAAGEAAQLTGEVSDEIRRPIRQANIVTRVNITSRNLEAYRLIRPFVANLQEGGYDSYLLPTELMERNCYREIRNGLGTLQMLDLTEPVMKGRAEVQRLIADVEGLLDTNMKEVVNG